MSMIHEALKKAYKEKTETQPAVPTTSYIQPEPPMAPAQPSNNRSIVTFSIILGLCIPAMAALFTTMNRERGQRIQAEMALVQKENVIEELKANVQNLAAENKKIEEQASKDRQEYLAVTQQLKEDFAELRSEHAALNAELDAKKKALGRLAYQVHQLENN